MKTRLVTLYLQIEIDVELEKKSNQFSQSDSVPSHDFNQKSVRHVIKTNWKEETDSEANLSLRLLMVPPISENR